jgi:hypothetical protein
LKFAVIVDAAADDGDQDVDAEKKKASRAKVKKMLESHRKRMLVQLDELAKKQETDPDFQKRLKEIEDARRAHPNEEKPSPKGIAELNVGQDDLFQVVES